MPASTRRLPLGRVLLLAARPPLPKRARQPIQPLKNSRNSVRARPYIVPEVGEHFPSRRDLGSRPTLGVEPTAVQVDDHLGEMPVRLKASGRRNASSSCAAASASSWRPTVLWTSMPGATSASSR